MNGSWLLDNWVAIVAAVISGLFALASIAAARRSVAVQNRMLQIEEQREGDRISATRKARFVARIVREPGRNRTPNFYLEIENLGQSPAHDIDVSLDDGPVLDHPTTLQRTEEIRQVGPQSSFRYMLVPSFSTNLPKNVQITWADESGEAGHYETSLT